MNFKKGISCISIVFFTLILLNSCKKKNGCTDSNADNYTSAANKDDGSCTYNLTRLSKAWLLTHYDVNGIDSTAEFKAVYANYGISFFKEKTYKEVYNPQPGVALTKNGVWDFEENFTKLKMIEKPSEAVKEFGIVVLGDTSLSISQSGSLTKTYTFSVK